MMIILVFRIMVFKVKDSQTDRLRSIISEYSIELF